MRKEDFEGGKLQNQHLMYTCILFPNYVYVFNHFYFSIQWNQSKIHLFFILQFSTLMFRVGIFFSSSVICLFGLLSPFETQFEKHWDSHVQFFVVLIGWVVINDDRMPVLCRWLKTTKIYTLYTHRFLSVFWFFLLVVFARLLSQLCFTLCCGVKRLS